MEVERFNNSILEPGSKSTIRAQKLNSVLCSYLHPFPEHTDAPETFCNGYCLAVDLYAERLYPS